MSKKIIIVIIVVAIVLTSGYLYFKDRQTGTYQKKTDESINGYSLEDDIRITKAIEARERAISLGQKQKMKFLASLLLAPKDNTILEKYNSTLPETIISTIQYPYYNISYDYFLINADQATMREKPSPVSTVVTTVENYEKVTLLEKVEGSLQAGSKIWYRVALEKSDGVKKGYIHATEGVPRSFKFANMQAAIDKLVKLLSEGELHFISNYKNYNGAAPRKDDANVDEFGYRATHSAPAYNQPDLNSNYRYVPDGILVRVLDEVGDFYQIYVPTFGANYYVPKQYIDGSQTLKYLNHVVVVDRNQQNQASFELTEGGLNLVSYTLSTTGISGEYSFVTTLGMFKALQKKDRFEYLEKGTSNVAGYAPYAIRFTGGAYIHGVPVVYEEDEEGNKIDPGMREYLHTIGTFPRSSMCVRNYTSHAQFLHSWMDIENGAVIVIE